MSINLGHHMYLCSKNEQKGSVNETSACGNLYYVPFAPEFMSAVNERGFEFLIVEPLNATQRLKLANSANPTLLMQAMVEVYENNLWWAFVALSIVLIASASFYFYHSIKCRTRKDLARNEKMLAL